jgi:hypothetical protein
MLGLANGSTQPTHGFPEYAMMRWIGEMLAYTAPPIKWPCGPAPHNIAAEIEIVSDGNGLDL